MAISLLECGGQGRNRTADASLFRAALYQGEGGGSVEKGRMDPMHSGDLSQSCLDYRSFLPKVDDDRFAFGVAFYEAPGSARSPSPNTGRASS